MRGLLPESGGPVARRNPGYHHAYSGHRGLRGGTFMIGRHALVLMIMGLLSAAAAGREAGDATGRRIQVPDRVERVMAEGPTGGVALYVLAPDLMVGWPSAPRLNEREFIRPGARDLPELGRLTGRGDTANVEVVLKARPDLIFDFGSVTPTFASLAARVQEQTGIPYLLIDGHLDHTAASLRELGRVLGVSARAEAVARYVEDTERLIDERLKDVPARRRVYLAREPNGLETGLAGSVTTAIIEPACGTKAAQTRSRACRICH